MSSIERIWLLTIEALDENDDPVTLRFASGDYTDDLGNYYDLRIKQPALFTTSAFVGSVIQTGSRTAFGETVLINMDGGLDYLADYAVDGRVSVLSLLDEQGSITDIITGTVQNLQFDDTTVSVRLRDPQAQLELEHPQNEYLGNNIPPDGLEGTADDIKGLPKPQCFGKVRNLEPVLVNAQRFIYEAHDLSSEPSVDVTVVAVYDRGVLIVKYAHYTNLTDFLNATIPSGQYVTYEGYIRLHTAPVGQITCDVDSDVFLMGDVFDLIASQAGYSVDSASVSLLNTFGTAGIFLREKTRTTVFFDLITQSIGGYWYFDKNSTMIKVNQLVDPVSPVAFFEDFQIKSITREKTGAGSNGIPVYKVKLKADKVEEVQNDVAAGADDIVRARVANEWREAVFESLAVRTRHPLSEEIEIETAFRDLTEAEVQAEHIQNLLGVRRDSVSCTVRLDAETANVLEIGKVVNITTYKLGYSLGKNFVILGFTLDARLSRAELELWG